MFNALIKKPKVTLIFLLLLVVIGSLTYFQIPKREIPEISLTVGTITTVYPGAAPNVVERDITTPLEKELLDIEGMDSVTSVSGLGASNIVMELTDDADRDKVFSQVQQKVSDVSREFPEDAFEPTINTDIQMGAIASYNVLHEDRALLIEQKDIIEGWIPQLEDIDGVRKVTVKGLEESSYTLNLDSESMQEERVLLPDVITAIQNELEITPLGSQQEGNQISQLTFEHIENIEEVENVFLKKDEEGNSLYVGDIASLTQIPIEQEDFITYNGTPAISLTIMQEKGVDIPTLHAKVDAEMERLSQDLPDEVDMELYYTQNDIVSKIFKDLGISFLISILAVVLITFFGLNAVSAILVAISIPVSIALGLIPLPYADVDLNQISIIGIIIALGILVDDAIVVNDNIQRRYQLGDSPLEGAIKGTKEVRVSIITSH